MRKSKDLTSNNFFQINKGLTLFPFTRNNQNFYLNTNEKLEFDTEGQVFFICVPWASKTTDTLTMLNKPQKVIPLLQLTLLGFMRVPVTEKRGPTVGNMIFRFFAF